MRTDSIDLNGLRLASGEGRRMDLEVALDPVEMGGQTYAIDPPQVPVKLDISRTTGQGYALRLGFDATLAGPCMRCLEPATLVVTVEAREVSQPGAGEELESPYVVEGALNLADWTRDALVLALPAQVLCRADCAGLCPVCGANMNDVGEEHHHDPEPDPRWAKLSELKFE